MSTPNSPDLASGLAAVGKAHGFDLFVARDLDFSDVPGWR